MKALLAAIPLAVALAASAAHASPATRGAAQAAYTEGQQQYAAGDYAGAAERFKTAYELDRDPVYLFNTAQALRFAKACSAAADYYQRFLAAAPAAPNRAKVERYIVDMTACAKTEAPPPSPDPHAAPAEATAAPSPEVAPPPEPAGSGAGESRPAPPPEGSSSSLRWVGVGVGIVGVAGLGVGVYEHLQVRAAADDREALRARKESSGEPWTTADTDEAARLDRKGKRASKLAIASYTLGGAALIGGIVLYVVTSRHHDEAPPRVSVVPTADGALVVGGFAF